MAILNNSNAISSGGYDINNSLRLRANSSAYLNRTNSTTGTSAGKTWTFSGWVKRGALGANRANMLAAGTWSGGNYISGIGFDSYNSPTDSLYVFCDIYGTGTQWQLKTSQVFRDVSAWYHIVVAVDTTQATSSNRVKIYVNGSQVTSFSTASYPSLNFANNPIGNNVAQYISANSSGTAENLDGYIAEYNFIDGQALTPSSFGETDTTTGSWKPKPYSGTYGTNGFYLKFSDIATTSGSNAGLGKDFSGNGNYFNTNNISVTSGTTYDAMKDSPTNTSATVGNYCVLNSTIRQLSGSITEGNLKGAGSSYECWGTIAFPSTGKYYFEYTHNGSTGAGNGPAIGIVGINKPDEDYGVKYNKNGTKWLNGTNSISYGASYTTGDVIGVAYDADNNSITFYKNNTSQGATTTTSGYTYLPYQFDNSGNGGFLNFGQRPFTYTPPSGYVALNTYNLPTPTILQGNKYMDATLYTGNDASNRLITNTAGFKPDLVWLKARSNTYNHYLDDSVRGAGYTLYSNLTDAENNYTTSFNSFNSNGFTVSQVAGVEMNKASQTYVGWQWQAGQGSTSSNTQGSITSTVSVNTSAGFSIVTYTGTNTNNQTVGHGLGVAPKLIINKARNYSSVSWNVYHASLGISYKLYLNGTNAQSASNNIWGLSNPTSTVFGVGTDGSFGTNDSYNYVAYCWAEIAGFSKFGSYTGNSSTDGPFVYLGFRPKYILIKCTSAGYDWVIYDSATGSYNVVSNNLWANLSNAEYSNTASTGLLIDLVSNGFKIRGTNTEVNNSGLTYIYAAFAENPFKNANAR